MARQFSLPQVAALGIHCGCIVAGTAASVRRKVGPYATRNNKRFAIEYRPGEGTYVQRLPVTDAELPGVE